MKYARMLTVLLGWLTLTMHAQTQSDLRAQVLGEDIPLSTGAEEAIKVVEYKRSEDTYITAGTGSSVTKQYGRGIPVLVCAPFHICVIGLEPGEVILQGGMFIGDSTNWNTFPMLAAGDRTEIIVKAFDAGLQTNLTIHTDRRTYIIELVSRQEEYIPYLSFRYPPTDTQRSSVGYDRGARGPQTTDEWDAYYAQIGQRNKLLDEFFERDSAVSHESEPDNTIYRGQIAIADLDFGYRVTGCRRCKWAPARVFNDGVKTHVVLAEDYKGELPVFTLIADGLQQKQQVINARWFGLRLEIDALFERGELSLGNKRILLAKTGS